MNSEPRLELDISPCMEIALCQEHGITAADLGEIEDDVKRAHGILQRERRDGVYGFYGLYENDDVFKDIKNTAAGFRERGIENLVVLGIGGSALGTTALATALKPPYYNLLRRDERDNRPRLFVMDNIDPVTFAGMMRLCPPDNTLYNVISKSGDTAETVSQLMIVAEAIENTLGAEALKDHIVITTNPRSGIGSDGKPIKPSLLYPVTDAHGIKTFIVPANVGGRFSVFSPVGMFPAAMLGMDLDALRAGCAVMDRRCRTPNLMENPAYLYAAVLYVADRKKGKRISVMMPYADALRDVADWYRQLWAESLGKRWSFDGDEVFAGQTPVKSLGVTDQHSQVQLYREGPNDKIVTIVEVSCFSETAPIPESFSEIPQFAYLRGKTMNKLMAAELRGTIEALKASLRPVVRIVLPEVSAGTVAQLLYLLEVATAMAGRLYNVNAFDQPGVEEGKRIARALMAL